MKWLEMFYPAYVYEDILQIDFEKLRQRGIKGLLIDLDNTVMPREDEVIPDVVAGWFKKRLSEGFGVCVLSNNWKKRVETALAPVNIPFVARAGKPLSKPFISGMEKLELKAEETAVIGDQIFTDVFGGNKAGMLTILVLPISQTDLPHTKALRHLETWIMKKAAVSREEER